jgi:hypothetical protein
MKQARFIRILLLTLGVSAAIWGVQAAASRGGASAAEASGAYAVTFHVNTPSTVPDGATITCNATVAPRLSLLDRLSPSAAPVESVNGVGKVTGSSAECTVQMPVAFAAGDRGHGAALSYRIDAFTSAGPVFVRTQQGIGVAVPQPGTTTNVELNVNL